MLAYGTKNLITQCFIKKQDPLLFFFTIYSNDNQFTQNFYQLYLKKIVIQNIQTKCGSSLNTLNILY